MLPPCGPHSAKAAWFSLPSLPKPPGPVSILQLLLQSVTPASIPVFLQLYWAAIVSLGRCGLLSWSQCSPSSHTGAGTRGICLPVTSWVEVTSIPLAQSMVKLLNICMKPVKGYGYVKLPFQRIAAQLRLCKTALNGPAPCVLSPSSGLWGWGHPIYFSNISWTPWVLDPITNPYLERCSWLHPVTMWDGGRDWVMHVQALEVQILPANHQEMRWGLEQTDHICSEGNL